MFTLNLKKKYLNSRDVRQEFSGLDYVKHGKWRIENETTYPLIIPAFSGVDVANLVPNVACVSGLFIRHYICALQVKPLLQG